MKSFLYLFDFFVFVMVEFNEYLMDGFVNSKVSLLERLASNGEYSALVKELEFAEFYKRVCPDYFFVYYGDLDFFGLESFCIANFDINYLKEKRVDSLEDLFVIFDGLDDVHINNFYIPDCDRVERRVLDVKQELLNSYVDVLDSSLKRFCSLAENSDSNNFYSLKNKFSKLTVEVKSPVLVDFFYKLDLIEGCFF